MLMKCHEGANLSEVRTQTEISRVLVWVQLAPKLGSYGTIERAGSKCVSRRMEQTELTTFICETHNAFPANLSYIFNSFNR